ncbi:MAG: biotin carboxyl carrier protein [Acidimicrobiales bacterium]
MRDVQFVDTTLRDGQQSLWALRMRTEMMLPALTDLDSAGLLGSEMVVPVTQFVRAVRELHEDPWEWVKAAAGKLRRTPLRMVGGSRSYFSKVPPCIEELLLCRLAELGIATARISDPWNDYDAIGRDLAFLADHGVDAVVNVIYSVSPRHTADYYAQRVREAVAAGARRLCFKDVGGLLTPPVAAVLLPLVVEAAGTVPVEFHAHCNNGFAPYCALQAADAGVVAIHTAIPPLANGTSQPSVFSVARNLAARGHRPCVDLEPLRRVSRHFEAVRRAEGLPTGDVLEYDEDAYRHQIPGGMRSTLRDHLGEVGMQDRLDETLEEVARVREELGYPIMVTPLSQFVGTQAALNVLGERRYGEVSDEVIGYALGQWGAEAMEVMDPEIRRRILDRPRASQIEAQLRSPAPDPTLGEIRAAYGEQVPDEELVLRVLVGAEGTDLGLERREVHESYEDYARAHHPVMAMLGRIAEIDLCGRVEYRTADWDLVVERGEANG